MLLFLDSGILQPIEYDVALGDSQSYVVKPRTFYLIYWEIHSRALSSLVMSNYLDTTIQERPPVGFRADSPGQICPSVIPGHVPELWMKMPSWKWGLWPQLLLLPAVWIIPAQTLRGREESSLLHPFQIPDTQNPYWLLFYVCLSPFELLYQSTTDRVSYK